MKLRIPPPFIVLACIILMWVSASYLPVLDVDFPYRVALALIVCIVGGVVNLMAVGLFVHHKTTVSPVAPDKAETLVTDGVYGYTRNPMYLGMLLLILAIGLWRGNLMVVPAAVLFVWYITQFQIKPEEEILSAKFGEKFNDYQAKVRRWI